MTTPRPTLDELRSGLKKLAWPREHRERGKVELRAGKDGRTLDMFIPFESESVDMGFREKIHPSAFTRSIRNGRKEQRNDIFALWSHDSSKPLARQANDTLDFHEDDDGLRALATLNPEIEYHREALQLVKDGLVRGTSFSFEVVRDEWAYDEDGDATRTLLEVRLFEVSPVVFPAYPGSDIEGRSALANAAKVAGLDLTEFCAALKEVRDGQFAPARADAVRAALKQLEGMIPAAQPAPVADDYYAKKLENRVRLLTGRAA